ncbi:MAG: N-acetylmuramoyl-L-alanine amidase [Candidatus Omnitrophica bacterium]|nr:N-acetylmuramoyl-L-alanine amidase [Candidatus Omnitrophota bacterium]
MMLARLFVYQKKTTIWALLLAIFFAGCSTTPTKPADTNPFPVSGILGPQNMIHIVGPSETLWGISKSYRVDINTLLRVNRLSDPNKIKKGQKLIIPSTLGPQPYILYPPNKRWTYIVIHHTATDVGNAFSIDQLHHKRGFWNGLGYHFLIDNGTATKVNGQIEVGPRWWKQMEGAHANAAGMNEKGIGIALVGNFSKTRVTTRQFASLVYLVRELQRHYRIPKSHVIRHSDVPGKNTECPGTLFPWEELKRQIY